MRVDGRLRELNLEFLQSLEQGQNLIYIELEQLKTLHEMLRVLRQIESNTSKKVVYLPGSVSVHVK